MLEMQNMQLAMNPSVAACTWVAQYRLQPRMFKTKHELQGPGAACIIDMRGLWTAVGATTLTILDSWIAVDALTLAQTTINSRIRGVAGSRHDQASLSLTEYRTSQGRSGSVGRPRGMRT